MAQQTVPIIWADAVQENYNANYLFRNLSVSEYEGELRQYGDQVKISTIAPFSASAVNRSSSITYQNVETNARILTVDQEYVVPVKHRSIDEIQSKPKLFAGVSAEMGKAVANQVEQAIANLYADNGGVITGTTGSATSGKISSSAFQAIAEVGSP